MNDEITEEQCEQYRQIREGRIQALRHVEDLLGEAIQRVPPEDNCGFYDDGQRDAYRTFRALIQSVREKMQYPFAIPQRWPDWLSPEYQAIVTMVKDAMKRAEDDICNSEDASGLPRTAEGQRIVYAGAIVHAFKWAGWVPPEPFPAGQVKP